MRKIVLLAVLLLFGLSVYAQKSYIYINKSTAGNFYKISGNLPSEKEVYDGVEIGDVLNDLSSKGYQVDFVPSFHEFILSSNPNSETLAQKSYIFLDGGVQFCRLSGDLPSDIKSEYSKSADSLEFGDLLNMLSTKGFEAEFTISSGSTIICILSKISSGQSSGVKKVVTNDGEPKEVARFNLQGFPVKESDKGFQIIVYSDYTAKTVIVR